MSLAPVASSASSSAASASCALADTAPVTDRDRLRTRLAMAMLMLMLVLAALDQTILATALPAIAADLPAVWPMPWLFSAYLLSATVVVTLYGRLADEFGRKPMLMLAIALFLVGSLGCAMAGDLPQLIIARAVQGSGGGGLMTLAMLAVVDLYSAQERGRQQGMLGAAYGVATMFGPLLGGWIVEHFSWHWAFWLNVPLAGLAVIVLSRTLPSTPRVRRGPIDVAGAVLLSLALTGLLLATQRNVSLPFGLSAGVMALLGLKLLAVFVWRQRRARSALLPLTLFVRPAYAATALISLVTGVALYAAVVFVPQYLQAALQRSPVDAAWHLLALMIGITVGTQVSGRRLRADLAPGAAKPADGELPRSSRAMAVSAGTLMAAAFIGLVLALRFWPGTAVLLALCLLPLGFGLGLLFPLVMVVSQRASDPRDIGVATAVPIMVRNLGGAGGVALLVMLLESTLPVASQSASANPWAVALLPVFGSAALLSVGVVLAARYLTDTQHDRA